MNAACVWPSATLRPPQRLQRRVHAAKHFSCPSLPTFTASFYLTGIIAKQCTFIRETYREMYLSTGYGGGYRNTLPAATATRVTAHINSMQYTKHSFARKHAIQRSPKPALRTWWKQKGTVYQQNTTQFQPKYLLKSQIVMYATKTVHANKNHNEKET